MNKNIIDTRLRDMRHETLDLSRVPKSRVPSQKLCSLTLNMYLP